MFGQLIVQLDRNNDLVSGEGCMYEKLDVEWEERTQEILLLMLGCDED